MRLRTTAGAYAGQIRDYAYAAGVNALRTGMAERIVEAPVASAGARTIATDPPPIVGHKQRPVARVAPARRR